MIRECRFFAMVGARTVRTVALLFAARVRGEPDRPDGSYDRLPRQWATDLLDDAGITATVTGLERLDGVGPCVFCCNHTSLVDVFAVAARLPGSIRFVAKRELLRVPFFGWGLRLSGQIPIDRKDRGAAVNAYAEAARALTAGKSALVFVEGTRSRDGRLQPFKKGAFVMAIATQVPCVPVFVSGAYELLRRGSVAPRPGRVEVRVGDAIPTTGMTYEDRDRLKERCWKAMQGLSENREQVTLGLPSSPETDVHHH